MSGERKRIAIVGSGVSGLVAASELDRAGHEVTVFEAGEWIGGHTDTHEVEAEGRTFRVDTGFIVLNDRNYPNFEQILAELGVATRASNMSFGVSDGIGEFEWSARGPQGIFARPRHLVDRDFLRMLFDIARFNHRAQALIGTRGTGPSLRAFLEEGGFSKYFIDRLLVPQASSIWSADPEQMWSFPAAFLAEFFNNHGTLQFRDRPKWRTVVGGSSSYVEAIIRPFAERVHRSTPVRRIEREADGGVTLQLDGTSAAFDEVVLACHSDQALAMLAEPTRLENEILGAIPYQSNQAVLHTDTSIMPTRRRAWASWNFHLDPRPGRTTLTYDMNRLQGIETAATSFLVTLNRTPLIDPSRVLAVRDYEHPVFTNEGMKAQDRWAEISGADRIHYCGAYWRWGFHEDGCWSGLRVSESLGGRGPGLGGIVPASIGASPGSERELQPA